jgi:transmembrane sensor
VPEREAYDWVMRFAVGGAGEDDLAALKHWTERSPAHREAYDRISRSWLSLEAITSAREAAPHSSTPVIALARGPHLTRRGLLGGALAASAASGAVLTAHPPWGLWPSWSELRADYRTGTGEQRQVALGRISIDMNTQTSIALLAEAGDGRGIELVAGEALMANPETASLTVRAGHGRMIVSRARLNVRHSGRQVDVTCLDGSVRVECDTGAREIAAGSQILYSDQGFGDVVTVDTGAVTAWQNGLVIFRSTSIVDVVEEVNRYRPGRVILTNPDLGHRLLNARFRIKDIDQVVSQIEQVFGAHATMLPGGIVLLG